MGPPLSNNAWSAIAFAHPTPLLPSSALQIPRGHAGKLSYPKKVNLTCRHWHCQQKYTLEYVKKKALSRTVGTSKTWKIVCPSCGSTSTGVVPLKMWDATEVLFAPDIAAREKRQKVKKRNSVFHK